MMQNATTAAGVPSPASVPALEPLPFPLHVVDTELLDYMNALLVRWSETYGLGSDQDRAVSRAFVQYCSPADVGRIGIEVTTEYLMWFFVMNDIPDGPHKHEVLRAAREALHGSPPTDERVVRATAGFRDRIIQRFGDRDLKRLFAALDGMFDSFFWEIERAGQNPSVKEYSANRQRTAAAYPHVELHRIASGVEPAAEVWPTVTALESLSVTIIWLTNDVMSVRRDARKGKQNLVFSIAEEKGVDWLQAYPWAIGLLQQRIDDFCAMRAELEASDKCDAAVRRYADFLGAYLEGNRVATVALTERYLGDG